MALPCTSFNVKLRLAGFAFAGHEPPAASADPSNQSSELSSVSSARASAPTVATIHRTRIGCVLPETLLNVSSVERGLNDGGHAREIRRRLRLVLRLARDEHERAAPGRPDGRLVPHDVDD